MVALLFCNTRRASTEGPPRKQRPLIARHRSDRFAEPANSARRSSQSRWPQSWPGTALRLSPITIISICRVTGELVDWRCEPVDRQTPCGGDLPTGTSSRQRRCADRAVYLRDRSVPCCQHRFTNVELVRLRNRSV